MPKWVDAGFAEYAKRVKGRFKLELVEIPAYKRNQPSDSVKAIAHEEEKILSVTKKSGLCIALDRKGKQVSTLQMSEQIDNWMTQGDRAHFIIGGPEGLSDGFCQSADQCWSLSKLTFAHPVARVLLAEQIYRCCSILENKPYHR